VSRGGAVVRSLILRVKGEYEVFVCSMRYALLSNITA
jgi:hypothetical protein